MYESHLLAGAERLLDGVPGDLILQLGAHESGPLSRLDVQVLCRSGSGGAAHWQASGLLTQDAIRRAVDFDEKARLKVVAGNGGSTA